MKYDFKTKIYYQEIYEQNLSYHYVRFYELAITILISFKWYL